jgi:hypothetical protein
VDAVELVVTVLHQVMQEQVELLVLLEAVVVVVPVDHIVLMDLVTETEVPVKMVILVIRVPERVVAMPGLAVLHTLGHQAEAQVMLVVLVQAVEQVMQEQAVAQVILVLLVGLV